MYAFMTFFGETETLKGHAEYTPFLIHVLEPECSEILQHSKSTFENDEFEGRSWRKIGESLEKVWRRIKVDFFSRFRDC
jgi:hypothetical protein